MNPPAEIARIYSEAGAGKTRLAAGKMFVLAVFAGIFIGFGAVGSAVAKCGVQPASLSSVVGALVFPIGLMMVLCAGAELFTGNNLILLSVADRKATLKGMLWNWLIVYLGNFVGSILLAAAVVYGHTYGAAGSDSALAHAVVGTASVKCGLSFGDAFLRGILCNFLVCIAVWVAFAAKELAGKIIGLMLPIFMFVLCGFEHCVANMYFIPAGIFASGVYGIDPGHASWGAFFLRNLLPVTLGNIVGGSALVAMGYWYAYLKKSN